MTSTVPVPDTPGNDLLTRTTLQIDAGMSGPSVLQIVSALHRVPGVLQAEVNAGSARAVVAHDAAVNASALLAAVAASGAHAEVVADTRVASRDAGLGIPPQRARVRRIMTVAAAVFVPLALIDALLPNTADKAWLLPVFISALWLFFFAELFVGRRP